MNLLATKWQSLRAYVPGNTTWDSNMWEEFFPTHYKGFNTYAFAILHVACPYLMTATGVTTISFDQ